LLKWLHIFLAALLVAGCATATAPRDSLDAIAIDYVKMTLEIGEHEEA